MSAIENISPAIIKRISKELNILAAQPPEGIRVIVNELDVCDIQAWILGPEGTPYEGGMFKIKVVLGTDFPSVPPKCYFMTKIFHPNVSKSGEVCVNTLKKDWNKDFGIERIFLTVKCLLIFPNPESALNEEAGKLLLEEYEEYAKYAIMMTKIHAQNKISEFFTNNNHNSNSRNNNNHNSNSHNNNSHNNNNSSNGTIPNNFSSSNISNNNNNNSNATTTITNTITSIGNTMITSATSSSSSSTSTITITNSYSSSPSPSSPLPKKFISPSSPPSLPSPTTISTTTTTPTPTTTNMAQTKMTINTNNNTNNNNNNMTMITTPLAPSQSINESTTSHLSIKKNPTASISSDNSNLSNITPKKRVASSDKKLDKKQADKKRSMKRL